VFNVNLSLLVLLRFLVGTGIEGSEGVVVKRSKRKTSYQHSLRRSMATECLSIRPNSNAAHHGLEKV